VPPQKKNKRLQAAPRHAITPNLTEPRPSGSEHTTFKLAKRP
jgi:hypothetical protein